MPIGRAYIMHESADINAVAAINVVDVPAQPKGLRDLWYSRSGTAFRRFIAAVIYRIYRLIGEIVALVLGVGIAVLWMATSVLDRQSTDLTLLRPNIKLWFSQAFDGRDAEFGKIELTWLPASDQVVVTVEDAKRPRMINAEVKGGVLTFSEDETGKIKAGLGPPGAVGRVGPVYRSGETKNSGIGTNFMDTLQGFEFIQITDAELHILSDVSGIDLRSDVEFLRVAFSDEGDLTLAADGAFYQSSGSIPFVITSVIDQGFENIKMRLKLEGARPDEIAPKKGRFWEFRGLAAPVNLTAEVDFSRKEGLRSAEVEMDVSAGRFTLLRETEPKSYPIDRIIARAALAPGEERMDVSQLDLSSPDLSFNASGFLTELGRLSDGNANSSPLFNLSARNIRANMTPRFSAETNIKQLDLIGYADFDSRLLDIERGTIYLSESVHAFSGGMSVTKQNQIKSVKFQSTMSGKLSPEELLLLWPVETFKSSRAWQSCLG